MPKAMFGHVQWDRSWVRQEMGLPPKPFPVPSGSSLVFAASEWTESFLRWQGLTCELIPCVCLCLMYWKTVLVTSCPLNGCILGNGWVQYLPCNLAGPQECRIDATNLLMTLRCLPASLGVRGVVPRGLKSIFTWLFTISSPNELEETLLPFFYWFFFFFSIKLSLGRQEKTVRSRANRFLPQVFFYLLLFHYLKSHWKHYQGTGILRMY